MQSDPIGELARVMKQVGKNKDIHLTLATVVDISPLTVELDGNGLVTSNLILMNHLQPQTYPVQIMFDDELGTRSGHIMISNGLEEGDRVAVIYDTEGNKIKGFIIDKEG